MRRPESLTLDTRQCDMEKKNSTCLAHDQSFLNLPQNVFRPEKLNNMMIILIH